MILANANSPLLEKWLQMDRFQFKIILVTVKSIGNFINKIQIERFNSKHSVIFSYLKLLFSIRKLIKKHNPDIIISHYFLHNGVIATLSRFHPHFAVAYGTDVFNFPKFLYPFIKLVANNSDKILVSAQFTKQHLIEKFKVKENKIVRSSWGINTKIFNLNDQRSKDNYLQFLKEFNISMDNKYILSPRVIRPEANQDVILYAFSEISKKNPNYRLIIIHYSSQKNTYYYEELIKIAKDLRINEKIIWLNRLVTPEEMSFFFSISELMFIIMDYDQLASTLLEGIACGCFPITSNLKPYQEVIENKKNGLIISQIKSDYIINAFDNFIENKDFYSKNTKEIANKIINNYNENSFVKLIEDISEKLIKNSKT
jgi:glycosyltransferase involved in cell wall biosynthesis